MEDEFPPDSAVGFLGVEHAFHRLLKNLARGDFEAA